ncbi:ABC transporter substrate-binding protein [Kutzneria kofuensis]|uniref:Multiple sugar transport system substrate-binding protein n=1 Tax=Kutzneria kofuensis TaxID=103725 RepID=A0A7W9KL79_9PSEU|nr:sugar ABC transporter substrate-binding protein [Kutzneria kofuensis]MBB5894614.1 multiple sugar transport system substrate-binding protein [Kutzneria kofuensis]
MPTNPLSRRGFLLGVAATTALGVAGCGLGGSSDDNADSGPVTGDVTGEIKFQTWALKPKYTDYINGLITAFQKQHAGVKVNWIDQPADGYLQKVTADAAAGNLPDVVNVPPDLSFPLARKKLLLNIDTAMPDARKDYLDNAWAAYAIPGQTGSYGFPWYLNTGPTFYNKALFRQVGLDPEHPPTNYSELENDALVMAQRSDKKIAMLGLTPVIADFGLYGVTVMNADGSKFTFNEPKGVQFVEMYKRLYDAGALIPEALTANYTGAGTKFMNQQIAWAPGSAYDLQNFKTNAPSLYANVGITKTITNTGKAVLYVQGLSVPAASKNKPTALAFAKFVTNAENQMAFAKLTAIFPSTKGTMSDPYFSQDGGTDEGRVRVAAAKQLETAVNYTPVQWSEQMTTLLQQKMSDAMQGKTSPKQALDDTVAQCNKLLAG